MTQTPELPSPPTREPGLVPVLSWREPSAVARRWLADLGAALAIDAAALILDGLLPTLPGLLIWRREQPAEVTVLDAHAPLDVLAAQAVKALALPVVHWRPLIYQDRPLGRLVVACRQPWAEAQAAEQSERLDRYQALGTAWLAHLETAQALAAALPDCARLRPPADTAALPAAPGADTGRPTPSAEGCPPSLLDQAREGYFHSTLDGHFTSVSPTLARLLGYATPAALVAQRRGLADCLEEPDHWAALQARLTAAGRVDGYELPARRGDGRAVWLAVTAQLIPGSDKAAPHCAALVAEITERKHAQERLRLLDAAFTAAANSIVITTREGAIATANPAFTRLTGYTLDEISGQNPRVLKSDQQPPAFYQALWTTILSGQVWQGEIVNRRKDGALYTEEMTIAPIRQADGAISHFVAIKQDVSERKRIESAERDQRALAEALVDTAAALNSSLDFDSVLDRILDNVGRVVPYDIASIGMFTESPRPTVRAEAGSPAGQLAWAMAHTDRPHVWRLARSGQPVQIPDVKTDPAWQASPDMAGVGSHLSTPILAHGQVLGLLTLDTTQRGFYDQRHAGRLQAFVDQAAIAIENARLYQILRQRAADSELLDHASVGLLDTTPGVPALAEHIAATITREFPHTTCAVLLLDAAETSLLPLARVNTASEPAAAAVPLSSQAPAAAAARTGSSVYVPPNTEGLSAAEWAPGAQLAIPLISGNRLLGVLDLHSWPGSHFDEHVRHLLAAYAGRAALALDNAQLMARLSQALEAAEAASRLKSEFLAVVSHELRTPLAHILGSLRIVLDGVSLTPEEDSAFVRTAFEAGQRLLGLVNDLLSYARLEAGQVSLEPQTTAIYPCLETVRRLAEPWAHSKHIALIIRPPAQPALSAWVDMERLVDVLRQLVSNAVKFTEHGSVTLAAGQAEASGEVWIAVEDTGIGLPANFQAELFKPFVQGDGSSTRRHGGLGLGLSLASHLTTLMNGRLAVYSAGPGLGSRFVLHFPAAPAEDAAHPPLALAQPAPAESPDGGPGQ